MSEKVFNYIKNVDRGPDYTGARADEYLNKYINRPEDAGNLEGFQSALNDMGILAPPADALNAAIYLAQGELGSAALSAAAVIPFIGEMRKGKQSAEKMITLYRGTRGVTDVNAVTKSGRIVGNWGETVKRYDRHNINYLKNFPNKPTQRGYMQSDSPLFQKTQDGKRFVFDVIGTGYKTLAGKGEVMHPSLPIGTKVQDLLFTTPKLEEAMRYTGGSQGGMILTFEVPLSYINKHARSATGRKMTTTGGYESKLSQDILEQVYPTVIFEKGIPHRYLKGADKTAKLTVNDAMKKLTEERLKRGPNPNVKLMEKTTSFDEKIAKIMNNPEASKNFLSNVNRVMKENTKKYK